MSAASSKMETPSRGFSATAIVLALICVMYGLTYIDRTNVSTASSIFQKDLRLNNTQVGLVFSAFAYPYLIFQIIGGWVGDRFGARLALTICALIWGGATLLTGLAGTLAAMLFARVLLGFGEGATFPTATRALCDWMPEGKRAFAQGITHSCARIGTALTPPVVAWLIAIGNWRLSFAVLGTVSIAWAVAWGFYFRDNPSEHHGVTSIELQQLPRYVLRAERKNRQCPGCRSRAACSR